MLILIGSLEYLVDFVFFWLFGLKICEKVVFYCPDLHFEPLCSIVALSKCLLPRHETTITHITARSGMGLEI